jgi:hypothetical protein
MHWDFVATLLPYFTTLFTAMQQQKLPIYLPLVSENGICKLQCWRTLVRMRLSYQQSISGRATAQAASRRLPKAAARNRARDTSRGICGGQSGTGVGFLRALRFPCQFSFHRLLHIHHLSSGDGTVGQLVAAVPSGLSLTPPQETKLKLNSRSISIAAVNSRLISF